MKTNFLFQLYIDLYIFKRFLIYWSISAPSSPSFSPIYVLPPKSLFTPKRHRKYVCVCVCVKKARLEDVYRNHFCDVVYFSTLHFINSPRRTRTVAYLMSLDWFLYFHPFRST